jgi:protein phosphatase PTC1
MGSTISIVYITQETEHNTIKNVVYSANAGDSRVVLVSKDGVKRLSYDHKCSDFSEINRIRQNGGIIIEGRVLGQLILSRAIGDHSLKRFGVICTPHINKHVLTENDRYIVIASDGLWDVVNDYDLLRIINNNSKLNLTQLTQYLVKHALDNGSTDNISCMVLKLN